MPLLFWYPMIVWSSMVGLALESASAATQAHAQTQRRETPREP